MKEYQELNQLVSPLLKKINRTVWLNHVIGPFIILVGMFATSLILLKMLLPDVAIYSLIFIGLIPPALLTSYIICRRNRYFFSQNQIIEIIDHIYKNDGSVCAAYENPQMVPSPEFFNTVREEIMENQPRLDPLFYIKKIIPVFLFLIVALLVPQRPPAALPQSREVLVAVTQPVFEKVQEYQDILPEEELNEFVAELDDIRKSREGISREKWEAVEEIEQRIDDAVKANQNSMAGIMSTMNQMSGLLSASDSIEGNEAEEQMQKLLDQLAEASKQINNPMSQAIQRKISSKIGKNGIGGLSGDALKKHLEDLSKKLGECGCIGKGPGDEGISEGNEPGSGGITRGRGDAKLTFGDEQLLDNAKYNEADLENKYFNPEDLVDMGLTVIEPQPDPGVFSPGTLKTFKDQEGSQVNRTRISPGQMEVVSRYFAAND